MTKFNLIRVNGLFRNVGSNLIGGATNGLLVLVTTPIYFSLLGPEGFGVYGFWLLLQLLSALFDAGLGATLAREFAKPSNIEESSGGTKADYLFTFECIFWSIGFLFLILIWMLSSYISSGWLIVQEMSNTEVERSVAMMGPAVGLFYINSLYLNAMTGMQVHVKMNLIQIVFNVARQGCGVLVLILFSSLTYVFLVQAVVYCMQALFLRHTVWGLVLVEKLPQRRFDFSCISKTGKFTSGMALTTIFSLLVASLDRLIVSKMLPIEDFASYTLAFSATSLLQMVFIAFYKSYFPKFAELHSGGSCLLLERTYTTGCVYFGIILVPISVTAFIFAPQIFYTWVGGASVSVVLIFRSLLVGVTCAGFMWIPIAFQQARGVNRIHLTLLFIALLFGLPLCYLAIQLFGVSGAATLWIFHGVTELTFGLWITHRSFGLCKIRYWYRAVVLKPLMISIPVCAIAYNIFGEYNGGIFVIIGIAFSLALQFLVLFYLLRATKFFKPEVNNL